MKQWLILKGIFFLERSLEEGGRRLISSRRAFRRARRADGPDLVAIGMLVALDVALDLLNELAMLIQKNKGGRTP